MPKTYVDALEARAKHCLAIVAQIPAWKGTHFLNYTEAKPIDGKLAEPDVVIYNLPGNWYGRIEFRGITFKDFANVKTGTPEKLASDPLIVAEKVVDNRAGQTPITTEIERSETNEQTQEKGFKQALTLGFEVGLEAGNENVKASTKFSTELSTEWDRRNIATKSETLTIKESVDTPPGVRERIETIFTRDKMREHVEGNIDLEHSVTIVAQRTPSKYHFILQWDSFSHFLQCVAGTAPSNWTGADTLRNANLRAVNRECIVRPTDAEIGAFNEYENCVSLSVKRTPF